MKNLITILLFFMFGFGANAQDIQFSQWQFSPLNVNPALAGVECSDQIALNFRSRWRAFFDSEEFQTAAISYDRFFSLKNGDRIGAGLNIESDWGNSGSFSQSGAGLAFSYQKSISRSETGEQFLVVGASGGWAQRAVDWSGLTWGTQHDGMGGFDPGLPSIEDFDKNRVNFADFAIGLSYLANFKKIKNLRLGVSSAHINRANISFDDSVEDEIYRRFTLHGQAEFSTGKKLSILPRILYTTQGPSALILAGTGIKYRFGSAQNQSFELAASLRGAHYLEEGIRMNGVLFSIAYFYKNIGFSVLGEKNQGFLPSDGNIDSFEAAVIYRFCK